MNIGELKKLLEEYPDDTPCAYDLWLPDDVRDVFASSQEDGGISTESVITDDDIAAILGQVEKDKDAEYGISWETIKKETEAHFSDDNRLSFRAPARNPHDMEEFSLRPELHLTLQGNNMEYIDAEVLRERFLEYCTSNMIGEPEQVEEYISCTDFSGYKGDIDDAVEDLAAGFQSEG